MTEQQQQRQEKSKGTDPVVREEKMRRAFEQGFREGIVQATQITSWVVRIYEDDTMINETSVDTSQQAMEFAQRYIDMAGVRIEITVAKDREQVQKAIEEGEREDIVDAEIVE